ncbi:MAG: N-6 DNA methylase [Bacillota bacterium]
MSDRITQQELESYLWGAAVYLRGTIDAGDYKQFIFPLLFYKRVCDVFDEETRAALAESGGDESFAAYPENHRFQVPADAHWRRVRNTASDIGQTLQSGMRAIETANPDKLFGIFGDAQWTNKDRLSDAMLRDLVEHFSTLDLSIANLPEDELGQGYEYLIKKFADDSGHTAAEFYTNRTVVHLMTELLEPQPGESIYDPTCGSGGMFLSAIARLRRQDKEWRNVRLYGQERNLMTSSIARMNCFLHGIEDFQIVRGDTLSDPKFIRGDRLMQFDVVLANPPYSIKQWDRAAFAADPWGRNIYGTPPQGRADYAFWQHILCSLKPDTGRSAILFPHGVLFRQEEAEMRRGLIEDDVIECVLGLGPNLFYNSPMEACVVICRTTKPSKRRGRILFINAVDQVTRERAQSFLADEHIERIVEAYRGFTDEPGFTRVATLEEVRAKGGSLSIPLYVESTTANGAEESASENTLVEALDAWATSRVEVASILPKVLPDASLPMLEEFIITSKADKIFEDRDGWARVRFGDVVENLNETERNPVESGLERFIGLEHLEPGSLHVRTWGSVADGTTFTRRCRPGQALFGKRRAYQRKVAVAEFDAVVSGDIYVLAPKNDRLLPDLLPFICLSERFFQHAVATSAGSLSPRTSWNSLARLELELPPMDQQRRIAEMLWAVDESTEGYRSLGRAMTRQLHARACLYTDMYVVAREGDSAIVPLGQLFGERRENGFGGLPIMSVTVEGRVVRRDSLDRCVIDKTGTDKYIRVCPGDIVYNTMRMWQGGCGVATEEGITSPAYTVLIPDRDLVDPGFWNYAFHTRALLELFRRYSTGVASDRWRLYYRSFAMIPVRVPPLELQRCLADRFTFSERAAVSVGEAADRLYAVVQSLADALMSGSYWEDRAWTRSPNPTPSSR